MDQKLANGWTRLILRRGMEGILPPAVQWRVHKGNLAFSFIRGLREFEGSQLEAVLFDDPSSIDEFVDMEVLRSTYERFFTSEPSLATNKDAMLLYRVALLARWLQEHGPGASTHRTIPAE
jgi:asparagine synthase (glutamine-hydrolysing)